MMRWVLTAALLLAGSPAFSMPPKTPRPAASAIIKPDPSALTLEERFELNRQARIEVARRAAARKDILAWGKALFPEKFDLPFCQEMHGYFVQIRGEEFTSTEAPRGHAKTTIKCFLIPLFQALNEPETFRHYLNVQATADKALAINTAIRTEIEENEELRELYGNQVGYSKWTDRQFVLRNGVVFTAIGAGQSVRGINYRSLRPDYIAADDLYDEEDINSSESTAKKSKWFWGSLYKARAIGRRTSIHVQGTATNAGDLLEELKKDSSVKSETFRAVKDWDKKLVLWVEANTFESLERDRVRMGTIIFMREMQNERRDDATSIVKAAWLEGWEYDPDTLNFSEERKLAGVLLGVDPSIGATKESDFTGVALVYEVRTPEATADGSDYYIDGLWNEHLSFDGRLSLLRAIKTAQMERGRPVTLANIEGIAGFKDFSSKAKGTGLPVREVDKVQNKITNLENKSHYFENRRVRLNKNLPKALKDMLVHQLTNNNPKHDDLRDGLLLVLKGREKPRLRVIA